MKRSIIFILTLLTQCTLGHVQGDSSELTKSNTPKRGGTLRLAIGSDLLKLDPAYANDFRSWFLQRAIFRGLLDYDDVNHQIVSDHAAKWRMSDDRKTYTFELKPGVRFANGREVEAEDYVYSFERMIDPTTAAVGQQYLPGIKGEEEFIHRKSAHISGLRAPNRQTLVIELNKPSYIFALRLTLPYAMVLPREVVQSQGKQFAEHVIGSGPYFLKEHKPGMSWRLERNPYYQGYGAFVDVIEVSIIGESYLHAMMVERGELDILFFPSSVDYVRMMRDLRLSKFMDVSNTADIYFVFMNTEMKPLDNVLVRRAVNHALNRERLTRLQLPGLPAEGMIPPWLDWSNPHLPHYDYNPTKARALLREAGFPSGVTVDFWYSQGLRRLAQGVAEDLRVAGIEVSQHKVTTEAYLDKIRTRKAVQMGLVDWGWDYPDIISMLDPVVNGSKITETECLNWAFYNNPEVTRFIVESDGEFDPIRRRKLFERIETQVMKDAPWAPINYAQNPTVRSPRLRGYRSHPHWAARLEELWLDQ